MLTPIFFTFIVFTYILGSISSAIILCKTMGFPDPRSEGSLNPGATNVLRIAGKKAAAITLVGDMLKGFIPTFAAHYFFDNSLTVIIIGFAAFIGHCYPIFYQFKGGKGVATAIGATLAFNWISGLFVVSIWLIIAKGFKLSSLAALIAFTTLPVFIYWQFKQAELSVVFIIIALILSARHKENIKRIIAGTEH